MSCGVGYRCGLDLALLWCRLTAAAPIWPLGWELPYASGAALKRQTDRKKGRRKKERKKGIKTDSLNCECKEKICIIFGICQSWRITNFIHVRVYTLWNHGPKFTMSRKGCVCLVQLCENSSGSDYSVNFKLKMGSYHGGSAVRNPAEPWGLGFDPCPCSVG